MLSCNSSFKGSRSIIERFHVFHVLHNHKRNLECDRNLQKTLRSSPVLPPLQLIQQTCKLRGVPETFREFSKNLLIVVSVSSSKSSGDLLPKNLFDEHFAQWDREVNQTADTPVSCMHRYHSQRRKIFHVHRLQFLGFFVGTLGYFFDLLDNGTVSNVGFPSLISSCFASRMVAATLFIWA